MRRAPIWHPIIFTCCPILYLYVHNANELTLPVLIGPLGVSLVLAGLVWWVVKLRQSDRYRAALIASALLLLFFSFGHLYNWTKVWSSLIPHWPIVFFVLWLLGTIALALVLARARYDTHMVSQGVEATAVVLLAISVLNVVHVEWIHQQAEYNSAPRVSAAATPARKQPAITPDKLPNIYYIILDSYVRSDILQSHFHGDNRDFLHYLRQRGFYIAEKSTSNYDQTIDSIPSSMNFEYLDGIAKKVGAGTSDRNPLARYIANCRVREVVKSYGYRFIAFPSEYALMSLPSDLNVKTISGLSDFENALIDTTPLITYKVAFADSVLDMYAQHRTFVLTEYANVPKANSIPGPFFAFVHFLAPHPPIVFDAQGHPLRGDPLEAKQRGRHWIRSREFTDEDARRYAEEVTYLDTLTQKMIETILGTATRPTVIILQADHGPGYLPQTREDKPKMDLLQKFAILNAYYFPDQDYSALYPTITPVNSFRLVFNHFLHTDYARLPDDHYFTPFTYPYQLLPVNEELKHPKPPVIPPAGAPSVLGNE